MKKVIPLVLLISFAISSTIALAGSCTIKNTTNLTFTIKSGGSTSTIGPYTSRSVSVYGNVTATSGSVEIQAYCSSGSSYKIVKSGSSYSIVSD